MTGRIAFHTLRLKQSQVLRLSFSKVRLPAFESASLKEDPVKGHVPTPDDLVDSMVARLFASNEPVAGDSLLDPGCGGGAFIAGVLRWCELNGVTSPQITGVELNPSLAAKARKRFADYPAVRIVQADYLLSPVTTSYRFIIGNPPYVSLANLGGNAQRDKYRKRFNSARGRFDLYMLFFERSIDTLAPNGRLVFITPEKFLYVSSAKELRRLLAARTIVASIHLAPEDAFPGFTTYPAITTLDRQTDEQTPTAVRLRCGTARQAQLPDDGESWWPCLMAEQTASDDPLLGDVSVRVSAGVATGADDVFVRAIADLPAQLRSFAKPAVAGRDLATGMPLPTPHRAILVPYRDTGELLPRADLGALGRYLASPSLKEALQSRSCAKRKPWYAFHDNFPPDILRPKILFKDITKEPFFWVDRTGDVIPLHSVYYIVPERDDQLDALCEWLNGPEASRWLEANCQRAANGFLRLQSSVLRRLPVPDHVLAQAPMRMAA